jgi:hypothetical protein
MIIVTEESFREAINRVAATTDGQIVLACLCEYSGFNKDIAVNDSIEQTYANAVLRRAYLYLRGFIRNEHLIDIEFGYRRGAEKKAGLKPVNPSERTRP